MSKERPVPDQTLGMLQRAILDEMRLAAPQWNGRQANDEVWHTLWTNAASKLGILQKYVEILGKPRGQFHSHDPDGYTIRVNRFTGINTASALVEQFLVQCGWMTIPASRLEFFFVNRKITEFVGDRVVVED